MAASKKTAKTTTKRAVRPKFARPAPTQTAASKPKAKPLAVARDPRPPRRVRLPQYKALRLKKRIRHPVRLPTAWQVAKQARQLAFKNWKTVGGVVLVYEVLNILLVQGLNGGANVADIKQQFDGLLHGFLGHLASSLGIFALLVSSSNATANSGNTTLYQSILLLIGGLALVWTYRQLRAGKPVRIRDAYYKGMYPLIPVILILLVITLQMLPILAGTWLFSIALQTGIAVTVVERVLWGLLLCLLILLSLYMLTSSVFALYVVTLADMTPMKALRSARELVRYRRWTVLRKVLFLPFWLLILGSVVMLPVILVIPVTAQWIFFGLTVVALALSHAYMYTLYRELLHEKN